MVLTTFHTLELPDSVNIVAVTEDRTVLLVEQYQHAVRRSSLEIPAEHVDLGEAPLEAARRELLEETGFVGGDWRLLTITFPYSSRLNCAVHGFLALGVRRAARAYTQPGPGRDHSGHGDALGRLHRPALRSRSHPARKQSARHGLACRTPNGRLFDMSLAHPQTR